MVKVVDYKTYQNSEGENYHSLVVEGGIQYNVSQTSGKLYITTLKTIIPCTFSEEQCISLIGEEIPGRIQRMEIQPYEKVNPETGESRVITHVNQFVPEEQSQLV
jgi:hypothetical protein